MDRYEKPVMPLLPQDPAPPSLRDNAALLEAIHASRDALEERIGEVRSEVTLLWQDLRNVADRVTETECRITELEDTVNTLEKDAGSTREILKEVAWRIDDAENRARRNNLRFVGFLEGAEGSRCGDFLKKWLMETFTPKKFST